VDGPRMRTRTAAPPTIGTRHREQMHGGRSEAVHINGPARLRGESDPTKQDDRPPERRIRIAVAVSMAEEEKHESTPNSKHKISAQITTPPTKYEPLKPGDGRGPASAPRTEPKMGQTPTVHPRRSSDKRDIRDEGQYTGSPNPARRPPRRAGWSTTATARAIITSVTRDVLMPKPRRSPQSRVRSQSCCCDSKAQVIRRPKSAGPHGPARSRLQLHGPGTRNRATIQAEYEHEQRNQETRSTARPRNSAATISLSVLLAPLTTRSTQGTFASAEGRCNRTG